MHNVYYGTYVYIYIHVHTCIHLEMYTCTYTCMYIYTYIYIVSNELITNVCTCTYHIVCNACATINHGSLEFLNEGILTSSTK